MNITRGKVQEAQKTVIYGPEGIGKSTLASQFPDPLFIDTEGSTSGMDVARFDRPTSFTMLMQQIKYVNEHPDICRTLVIDTADWAEQLCIAEFCAKKQITGIEDIGYGKGYVYVAEDFGRMLNLLEDIKQKGINIVITAHAQMRKFEQPDELGAYDRWELKLQKKTAPLLKEWADMVLFCNYKTIVVNVDNQGAAKGKNKAQGGKRVMYTEHHPCWDAKNRHGLQPELDMNYSSIAHCIPDTSVSAQSARVEPAATVQAPQPTALQVPQPVTPQNTQTTTSQQREDTSPRQIPAGGTGTGNAAAPPEKKPEETYADIPRQVADLIRTADFMILETDIMNVVAQKGYFPRGTRLKDCPQEFIDGWMVPFWDKIVAMIIENKKQNGEFFPNNEQEEMPFN